MFGNIELLTSPVLKDMQITAGLGQTVRSCGQALPYGLAQLGGRWSRQGEATVLSIWWQFCRKH